jgi:hypothetical protein
MNLLSNLARAATAVVLTPAAVVADVLTLPDSAYRGTGPFPRAAGLLKAAGECVTEATKPVKDEQ